MKRWIMIGILCLCAPVFGRTLNVGVTPTNPPYSTQIDKTHFYGFEISIMLEVCSRLHAKCHFMPMGFDDLFLSLDSKVIDLAIAMITISPAREKQYLFSIPYIPSLAELILNNSSPVNSVKDLRNKKIGVHQGNITSAFLSSRYNQPMTAVNYPNTGDVFMALEQSLVDAALMELGSARYWYANNASQYKLLPPIICVGNGSGIMANKGSGPLIAEVDQALRAMETDGTYVKIYQLYPSLLGPTNVGLPKKKCLN